jgi:hypothetical protein
MSIAGMEGLARAFQILPGWVKLGCDPICGIAGALLD